MSWFGGNNEQRQTVKVIYGLIEYNIQLEDGNTLADFITELAIQKNSQRNTGIDELNEAEPTKNNSSDEQTI